MLTWLTPGRDCCCCKGRHYGVWPSLPSSICPGSWSGRQAPNESRLLISAEFTFVLALTSNANQSELNCCLQGTSHDAAQSMWQLADTLRYSIGSAMTDHTVPGVRLQATKLLEHIVLLFTADTVPVLVPGSNAMTMQRLATLRTILTPTTVSSCGMLFVHNVGEIWKATSTSDCNINRRNIANLRCF